MLIREKGSCRDMAKGKRKTLERIVIENYFGENIEKVSEERHRELVKELYEEHGIKVCSNNLDIEGYNTGNYRSKEEMVERLCLEGEEAHYNNWWSEILDEDDFCDLDAGDDSEYMEIMYVVSVLNELPDEVEQRLWRPAYL